MKYGMMALVSLMLVSTVAQAQTADKRVPLEPSPPQASCVSAKWTEIAITESTRPAKLFGCLVNGVHKPEIKHQKQCLRLNTCPTPKTGR